jgi:GNAT superfamily N-acetyltransferase
MELEVRAAALAEVALVSGILTEAAVWLRERGMPLWAPHEVAASRVAPEVQAGHFFLAWSGPAAVGTMRLTPADPVFWPEAAQGEALYLHRLAVRRVVAGGLVSSGLLRWAVGHAAARGARYLRLDCEASRPNLRRVYERFGFSFHSMRTVGPCMVARYELACTHVP